MNWRLISNSTNNDTLIQYDFQKKDLQNIRLYIVSLEKYRELYEVDQQIVIKQQREIDTYKLLTDNQKDIIQFNNDIISEYNNANQKLVKDVKKYKKRSEKWPYFLGAGFIGGILTSILVK